MQKTIVLALILLALSSCTSVRKRAPIKIGIQIFDKIDSKIEVIQNKNLTITYTTCRKISADPASSRTYLRDEFKKKFNQTLLGLSNLTISKTSVLDSSIFVSNEICHKVVGNPLTSKKLSKLTITTWQLTDPSHHIH